MTSADTDDPYLWLEEIDSPAVREWILARNAATVGALCDARFETDRKTVLDLLNADDRIPWIGRRGAHVYNLWQDAARPKGLWRRTTLADYRKAEPAWDVLLDLDALAREDWVWQGCDALPPDYRRGLLRLSRGGADANVIREFDIEAKRFVADGFSLPEAKTSAAWMDQDRLLVASPLGGDEFATESGYARTVRLWRRGTPFAEAPIVFEGKRSDVWIYSWHGHDAPRPHTFFARALDFINTEIFVGYEPGSRRRLDVPTDASVSVFRDRLLVNPRTDWTVAERRYPAGALLAIGFDAFMAGARDFAVLFAPTERAFLQGFEMARDVVAMKVLDDVRSRVMLARADGASWHVERLEGFSEQAVVDIARLDQDFSYAFVPAEEADEFLLYVNDAVTPLTLSLARVGEKSELLKAAPARFDARGLAITQHHALADDGARIPYFQVGRADLARDGSNAVLLTGYGGFQLSSLPYYSLINGRLWLARGGVMVIANIRGGGEFGPAWHEAGRRAGKKRAHDDFAAVARDLVARGVTRRARLACSGGSNGGLLVGNMYTRYPELFGAIVCDVPLLDMRRYTRLTAGASWVAEYGDPDKPEDWAFLQEISAYQLVASGQDYPPILLTTSARDDRVHPGHARKMAAKLLALGARVYFHEPSEGGHAGATDNAHIAYNEALSFAFLRHTIAPEMT